MNTRFFKKIPSLLVLLSSMLSITASPAEQLATITHLLNVITYVEHGVIAAAAFESGVQQDLLWQIKTALNSYKTGVASESILPLDQNFETILSRENGVAILRTLTIQMLEELLDNEAFFSWIETNSNEWKDFITNMHDDSRTILLEKLSEKNPVLTVGVFSEGETLPLTQSAFTLKNGYALYETANPETQPTLALYSSCQGISRKEKIYQLPRGYTNSTLIGVYEHADTTHALLKLHDSRLGVLTLNDSAIMSSDATPLAAKYAISSSGRLICSGSIGSPLRIMHINDQGEVSSQSFPAITTVLSAQITDDEQMALINGMYRRNGMNERKRSFVLMVRNGEEFALHHVFRAPTGFGTMRQLSRTDGITRYHIFVQADSTIRIYEVATDQGSHTSPQWLYTITNAQLLTPPGHRTMDSTSCSNLVPIINNNELIFLSYDAHKAQWLRLDSNRINTLPSDTPTALCSSTDNSVTICAPFKLEEGVSVVEPPYILQRLDKKNERFICTNLANPLETSGGIMLSHDGAIMTLHRGMDLSTNMLPRPVHSRIFHKKSLDCSDSTCTSLEDWQHRCIERTTDIGIAATLIKRGLPKKCITTGPLLPQPMTEKTSYLYPLTQEIANPELKKLFLGEQ